ncbi:MAG: SLC13 family permease [Senegalimassilia anaerobia]|uniref:SLC13 family permease n=1 Tax=Senegalimassilia anaerobia TaxID=1473216 RepID=UPI002E796708|nr:SLC13 family permease [Senegalimassilia anaerobia]MEE0303081.1 SLC13 family permease [Senegalimassilia anaerobia]
MIRTENISLRSAVRVIRAFAARETVLVVAVAAALASCALVPPDAGYAAYVDWHTLALLALVVLRRAGMEGRMCLVATLMTIAANLGSMFTPVGNPQNLYLFTASGMGVGEFLQLMGPYTAASGTMLVLACVLCFRGSEVRGAGGVGRFALSGGFASDDTAGNPAMQVPPARRTAPEGYAPDFMTARLANGVSPASLPPESASPDCFPARSRKRLAVHGMLFACCLAAVLGVLDVRVLLALVLVGVSLSDASLLRRVDWGLLATFAALFVFVGNMGRVPVLHEALSAAVGGNALLAAVGGSQVVSNVPAAVLLSGFTDQWQALIVGTNLGGLGTLIASMASLITFKAVMVGRPGIRGRYLLVFTAWNIAFLAVLLALAVVLGAL